LPVARRPGRARPLSPQSRGSRSGSPVDTIHAATEMPIAPIQVVLCKHRVHHHRHHHGPRQIQFPIAIAAQPVPHFPRLRALALFSRRPPHRVVRPSFRRPKTCTGAEEEIANGHSATIMFTVFNDLEIIVVSDLISEAEKVTDEWSFLR